MAHTYDTTCLYSSVKNTSGGRKKFGFLPPHGRELIANEVFTVFGDIRQAIIRNERVTDQRQIRAFEAAIARGDIVILQTPSPILEAPNGHNYALTVANGGALSSAEPCWRTSLT